MEERGKGESRDGGECDRRKEGDVGERERRKKEDGGEEKEKGGRWRRGGKV